GIRHAIPCGTERSEPVQMLKITPVFPGAMTENELTRPASTTTATAAVAILLISRARSSGELTTVFIVVLPVCRMAAVVGDIDQRRAPPPMREKSEKVTFEA